MSSTPNIQNFYAGLEPLRAFVCSYPMDGIVRVSEERCRPTNDILSDSTNTFTDQPRLCYRKHCSLQHHPCFRAMINLKPRIRRPRWFSARAKNTPVAPTADSKRNALLSALFWPFHELLRSPLRKILPLPARLWYSGNFLSQTTLTRSVLRETSVQTFFGRIRAHRASSKATRLFLTK